MFIKCILPPGKRILKLLHCQNEVSRNDCFDCHSCIRTGSFNMWESHAGMIENIWAHRYSSFHLLLQGGIPDDPKFILRRGECYRRIYKQFCEGWLSTSRPAHNPRTESQLLLWGCASWWIRSKSRSCDWTTCIDFPKYTPEEFFSASTLNICRVTHTRKFEA